MATILSVVAVAATGAIIPFVLKRWVEAQSQMERLRMQRMRDPRQRHSHSH